jgi:hypothetical protein
MRVFHVGRLIEGMGGPPLEDAALLVDGLFAPK